MLQSKMVEFAYRAKNRNKINVLDGNEHAICKLYKVSPYGSLNEREMYTIINGPSYQSESILERLQLKLTDQQLAFWQSYTPKFYGESDAHDEHCQQGPETMIRLENLIARKRSLCLMDLKLGANNCGSSDPQRIKFKTEKYLRRLDLKFSFDGFVLNSVQNLALSKEECRSKDLAGVIECFRHFIQNVPNKLIQRKMLGRIKHDLGTMRKFFVSSENKFRLYGTSILITYDRDDLDEDLNSFSLALIDFEHVVVDNGSECGDENVVESLIKLEEAFGSLGGI